jgi:hypothetical protein
VVVISQALFSPSACSSHPIQYLAPIHPLAQLRRRRTTTHAAANIPSFFFFLSRDITLGRHADHNTRPTFNNQLILRASRLAAIRKPHSFPIIIRRSFRIPQNPLSPCAVGLWLFLSYQDAQSFARDSPAARPRSCSGISFPISPSSTPFSPRNRSAR